jgi:hypothetical protein
MHADEFILYPDKKYLRDPCLRRITDIDFLSH